MKIEISWVKGGMGGGVPGSLDPNLELQYIFLMLLPKNAGRRTTA